MENVNSQYLKLLELTPEEKSKRGILARLYGPIADTVRATRNGRKYSDEVWENIFNKNEVVNELIEKGGIPGEAQHPTNRTEIDTEKIAIMMPEKPRKGEDGLLMGFFDILDTPCGRIAYQLAKYGFKLGVSSRGNGDVIGDEVDPTTYDFTCFDLVIVPAVEKARMEMIESYNGNKSFKQSLVESLNNSTKDEQKIMKETLKELNIDITESATDSKPANKDGQNSEKSSDNKPVVESTSNNSEATQEASNNEIEEVVKNLQEVLQSKSDGEKRVKTLQSELATSNARVKELTEELAKYKFANVRLTEVSIRDRKALKESLKVKEELDATKKLVDNQNSKISQLNERRMHSLSKNHSLNESLLSKDNEIKKLNKNLTSLKTDYESKLNSSKKALEEEKSTNSKKLEKLNEQLTKVTTDAKSYKKLAESIMESYIDNKATNLGVEIQEIKSKLPDSYDVSDVDNVCESLSKYALNVSKLPFDVSKKAKVVITESKNESLASNNKIDDFVDDNLIALAKIKK